MSQIVFINCRSFQAIRPDDQNHEPANTIKPNDGWCSEDKFKFDVFDNLTEDDCQKLIKKFRKYGDNPSDKCLRQVYDLMHSKMLDVKKSIYTDEVKKIEECIDSKRSSYMGMNGWYFEVGDPQSMYLVYQYSRDLGYGCSCGESKTPLAIFADEYDAVRFQEKCANVYHSENIQAKAIGEYHIRLEARYEKLSIIEQQNN